MPLHLEDLDVVSAARGLHSVLIVPCNMCPAVTAAVDQNRPFLRLHRSPFRSAPFAERVRALQSRLRQEGVHADVFRSDLYHHWFLCMWTAGRRRKLEKRASGYDAVVVLGCDTATVTVGDAVESTGCRVIEGMEVTGYMNAKLRFRAPASVSFADSRIIPLSGPRSRRGRAGQGAGASVASS